MSNNRTAPPTGASTTPRQRQAEEEGVASPDSSTVDSSLNTDGDCYGGLKCECDVTQWLHSKLTAFASSGKKLTSDEWILVQGVARLLWLGCGSPIKMWGAPYDSSGGVRSEKWDLVGNRQKVNNHLMNAWKRYKVKDPRLKGFFKDVSSDEVLRHRVRPRQGSSVDQQYKTEIADFFATNGAPLATAEDVLEYLISQSNVKTVQEYENEKNLLRPTKCVEQVIKETKFNENHRRDKDLVVWLKAPHGFGGGRFIATLIDAITTSHGMVCAIKIKVDLSTPSAKQVTVLNKWIGEESDQARLLVVDLREAPLTPPRAICENVIAIISGVVRISPVPKKNLVIFLAPRRYFFHDWLHVYSTSPPGLRLDCVLYRSDLSVPHSVPTSSKNILAEESNKILAEEQFLAWLHDPNRDGTYPAGIVADFLTKNQLPCQIDVNSASWNRLSGSWGSDDAMEKWRDLMPTYFFSVNPKCRLPNVFLRSDCEIESPNRAICLFPIRSTFVEPPMIGSNSGSFSER